MRKGQRKHIINEEENTGEKKILEEVNPTIQIEKTIKYTSNKSIKNIRIPQMEKT